MKTASAAALDQGLPARARAEAALYGELADSRVLQEREGPRPEGDGLPALPTIILGRESDDWSPTPPLPPQPPQQPTRQQHPQQLQEQREHSPGAGDTEDEPAVATTPNSTSPVATTQRQEEEPPGDIEDITSDLTPEAGRSLPDSMHATAADTRPGTDAPPLQQPHAALQDLERHPEEGACGQRRPEEAAGVGEPAASRAREHASPQTAAGPAVPTRATVHISSELTRAGPQPQNASSESAGRCPAPCAIESPGAEEAVPAAAVQLQPAPGQVAAGTLPLQQECAQPAAMSTAATAGLPAVAPGPRPAGMYAAAPTADDAGQEDLRAQIAWLRAELRAAQARNIEANPEVSSAPRLLCEDAIYRTTFSPACSI